MSIAPPVGALSAYLSRLLSGFTYRSLREGGKQLARKMPRFVYESARRAEELTRGFFTGGTMFEQLGFYYVGPIDGHNLSHLLPVLENVRDPSRGRYSFTSSPRKVTATAPPKQRRTSCTASGLSMSSAASNTSRRRTPPPTPRYSARRSSRRRARTSGLSR